MMEETVMSMEPFEKLYQAGKLAAFKEVLAFIEGLHPDLIVASDVAEMCQKSARECREAGAYEQYLGVYPK